MSVYDTILEAIRDEIKVPAALKRVIDTANSDLYSGPVYLTKYGQECSHLDDDYHHQFNFVRACRIISDWIDNQGDPIRYYETWSGCLVPKMEFDESTDAFDYIEVNREDICTALCGRELARYV